jgi:hypothetical protein
MEKKRQHIIPKCYQRAWCDPATPAKQTPYIWMISKDGKHKKHKAPEKAFVGSDVYTVRLPDGGRELLIENTLAGTESGFVQLVEHKIKGHYGLDAQDKANLCVFAAAMFSRVEPQARAHIKFLQDIHDKVKGMEEQHNAEPRSSLETADMLDNAWPKYVAMSLQMLSALYYDMALAILIASPPDYFITSDSPTVWYNPEAYKVPPFWRSPGLAQEKVEVTMPLTPHYALYLSHNEKIGGYRRLPGKLVQEFNRRTRFHCDHWFVSWQGEIRESWFDEGTPPEDRWENTPAGIRAAEQCKKQEELERQYNERMAN